MPVAIPPASEEAVLRLRDGRRLGYAIYGDPGGDAVLWFHGTPGGRRQVPPGVRIAAQERHVRVVGIDRPGTGASSGHLHGSILDYTSDIEQLADTLGAERFGIVGLSGGGPYVLGCAYAMPHAWSQGSSSAASRRRSATTASMAVSRSSRSASARCSRCCANRSVSRSPRSPASRDRSRTRRSSSTCARRHPETNACSRTRRCARCSSPICAARRGTGLKAPVYDAILFGKHWGFSPADIKVPIAFWHGDADNIVPLHHARHLQALVRGSTLSVRSGESHLGALEAGEEILDTILGHWSDREHAPERA